MSLSDKAKAAVRAEVPGRPLDPYDQSLTWPKTGETLDVSSFMLENKFILTNVLPQLQQMKADLDKVLSTYPKVPPTQVPRNKGDAVYRSRSSLLA